MKKSALLIATSAVLTLLITAYLYIAIFPACLFPHISVHDNVTVRSTIPVDPGLFPLLDSTRSLLRHSTLYDSAISYRVYFCENYPLYALFLPASFGSFGATYSLVNRIYVAKTDPIHDHCFANKPRNNQRSLHTLLAHEMMHCLLTKRFGLWRTIFAPKWKTEGYCEFISGESSFDTCAGIQLIKQGKQDRSFSFSYFKYRLYVTYLIARKGLTIEEIMDTRFNTKKLDAEIRVVADSLLEVRSKQR